MAARAKGLTMADVMYRAGSGDVTVLPDLGRLAIDRSQGALLRASAADYVARMLLGGSLEGPSKVQSQTSLATGAAASRPIALAPDALKPELVNMLIAAAADPEPIVRAAAVRALAATGQTARVASPLTARLVDQARVVRARAAEALLTLGIAQLPGAAGDGAGEGPGRLRGQPRGVSELRRQSRVARMARVRARAQRRGPAALDRAIQVDPAFARPYVVKGVLAARAGRYQEAVDFWKKARSLEPAYPRIDTLIAEGEKRKAGAR